MQKAYLHRATFLLLKAFTLQHHERNNFSHSSFFSDSSVFIRRYPGLWGCFPFIDFAPSTAGKLYRLSSSFDVDATNCAVHKRNAVRLWTSTLLSQNDFRITPLLLQQPIVHNVVFIYHSIHCRLPSSQLYHD